MRSIPWAEALQHGRDAGDPDPAETLRDALWRGYIDASGALTWRDQEPEEKDRMPAAWWRRVLSFNPTTAEAGDWRRALQSRPDLAALPDAETPIFFDGGSTRDGATPISATRIRLSPRDAVLALWPARAARQPHAPNVKRDVHIEAARILAASEIAPGRGSAKRLAERLKADPRFSDHNLGTLTRYSNAAHKAWRSGKSD